MAISSLKIPTYACPSDTLSDTARGVSRGRATLYPTTYGFNFGTWFVWDPVSRKGGDGAFFPNAKLATEHFVDGTTNTMLAAEVKAWTPYLRNGGPPTTAVPQMASDVQTLLPSASQFKNTGHTEWPDGRVHHQGFTTVLTPNTSVPYVNSHGETLDVDYNSWQEGKNGMNGSPTYASITSRSHHVGIVQILMADGSSRSITNSINQGIWRGLGTRDGGEIPGEF